MNDSIDHETLKAELDRFRATVTGVTHVLAVASDGILLASTSSLDRDQAERVAAASSGFCGLARQVNEDVGGKGVRAVCVEMSVGSLFIIETSGGARLAAAIVAGSDTSNVLYQLGQLAPKVGAKALTMAARRG